MIGRATRREWLVRRRLDERFAMCSTFKLPLLPPS